MSGNRRLERSDVEGPLWRKKIDASLFRTYETPVPKWVARMWEIPKHFPNLSSRQADSNKIQVLWRDNKSWEKLDGWLLKRSGRREEYRIRFSKMFSNKLIKSAPSSFFEAIESELISKNDLASNHYSTWEFLDIEFIPDDKVFRCRVYFNQKTDFPNLFKALSDSPLLAALEQKHLHKKLATKAYYSDWKPWGQLDSEIDVNNCIYTLLDAKNDRIYIGQASNLIKRLKQHQKVKSSNWTDYRFCILPAELSAHRELIERLIIRLVADLIPNKVDDRAKLKIIHQLTNLKID